MDIEQFLLDVTNENLLAWKTAFAALVIGLAGFQVATAARVWGAGGLPLSEATAARIHRWSGRLLLVLSVMLAYTCLFGLAGPTSPTRVLLHSILGGTLFVVLAVKFSALRLGRPSDRHLPVIGSLLFVNYVAIWALSALDYVMNGEPEPSSQLQIWVWAASAVGLAFGGFGLAVFALSRQRQVKHT